MDIDLGRYMNMRILRSHNAFREKGVGTSIYNINLPTAPPSPEEGIIENRGLQIKPATYNYGAPDHVFFKTPTKSPKKVSPLLRLSSPVKTPVRSSPRKRLNLSPDVTFHEDGFTIITSTPKHTRNEVLQNVKPSSKIGINLKALNHSQLVNLINEVLEFFPGADEFLVKRIPEPDLGPIEYRLSALQRTVNKSIPRNVWGSQDSSFTFLRVRSHLEAFKRECLEYCDRFLESQHWPTFFEYVLIAWKHILLLPNWSLATHNRPKSMCLKQIGHKFIIALHEASLNEAALHELISRMKKYEEEETVKACISAATLLLKEKSSVN